MSSELQQSKIMNSNISRYMESIRIEHDQLNKDLKENKALHDLRQNNLLEML